MAKEKNSTILSLWYYLCQNTGNIEIVLCRDLIRKDFLKVHKTKFLK